MTINEPMFGVSYNSLLNINKGSKKKKNGNGNKGALRYCIMHDVIVRECKDTTCPLYDCSFSKMHKMMTSMFKNSYPTMSTHDSRKISRRLLLNTFRKNRKEEDIFGISELFK